MSTSTPHPLKATRSGPLSGKVRVPGDKSISHRALMFGALATGLTHITGLLEADDVLNTGSCRGSTGCNRQQDARRLGGHGAGHRRAVAAEGPLGFW